MERDGFDIDAFGQSLIRRRRLLGWSSHRLAVRAGVSDPYLAALERGEGKRLGVEIIARLARALNTTVDDLLRDAGLPVAGMDTSELNSLYGDLDTPYRRALLSIGHTLRELQSEYHALQEPDDPDGEPTEDGGPPTAEDIRQRKKAAHDSSDEEADAIRRDAEEYEE